MQSYNHVAGGFAFTGIFASFADLNIYERVDTMAVVWVASMLPDVDHTRSLIGKSVWPLARWLQSRYGHRTITHSLPFFAAMVMLVRGMDMLWNLSYTLPFALALGSHLIYDMCTRQGIPIFYPFSRRPAVLPANPALRLSANDFRSEAILFVLFCGLNVFAYPLMAAGFWTKYNQKLGTWEHLESEKLRKPGDYEVKVVVEGDSVRGTLYEVAEGKVILWTGKGFRTLKKEDCRLAGFQRMNTSHQLRTVNLLNVSVDSVNAWLRRPVVKLTIQSRQELYYFQGSIMQKGTNLSLDFPGEVRFYQLPVDNREIDAQLQMLELKFETERRAYKAKEQELLTLKAALKREQERTSTSNYDEGVRRERMVDLTRQIESFTLPTPPDEQLHQMERSILQMKREHEDRLSALLLIWETR